MLAAHSCTLGLLRSAFRHQPSCMLAAGVTCGPIVGSMSVQAALQPCGRPHAARQLRTLAAWLPARSLASAAGLRGCGSLLPASACQTANGTLAQLEQARGLRTLRKRVKVPSSPPARLHAS